MKTTNSHNMMQEALLNEVFDNLDNKKGLSRKVFESVIFALGEIPMLLLRKHVYHRRVNATSFVICLLVLAVLTITFLVMADDNAQMMDESITSHYIGAATTVAIGIVMILKVWRIAANQYVANDISYFDFLLKDKMWKDSKFGKAFVRLVAEPSFMISVGITWSFYNILMGVFIIACGVSTFFRAYMNRRFLQNNIAAQFTAYDEQNIDDSNIGAK